LPFFSLQEGSYGFNSREEMGDEIYYECSNLNAERLLKTCRPRRRLVVLVNYSIKIDTGISEF
jgi:hypothetical protein